MKKSIYLIIRLFLLSIVMLSCEDFLEKPPGVDVTEDIVFSSKEQVEYFIAGTYYYGVMSDFPYWDERDKNDTHLSAASDESEIFQSWYWCQEPWNAGLMSQNNQFATGDRRFPTHWVAIRRANTILERADDAPFNDDAFKKRAKGEAYAIRALNYFELFRKYGGVPILEERLDPSGDLAVPRSTVQEVVDFILTDCEQAIELLPKPNTLTNAERGRLTNVAAMAIKSRTLLYAASPTFNTDTPYMSMDDGDNKLIIYGNFDKNRWKLAADAAQNAIAEALATGLDLVRDKKNGNQDVTYRYIWEYPDNEEVILADQPKGQLRFDNFPWGPNLPASCGGFGGGLSMTFNFLKLYEKKDGTPQSWNSEGGDNLMQKYSELDPRFGQTAAYHKQPWNENDNPSLDCSVGGRDECIGGQFIHKPIPYDLSSNPTVMVAPKGTIFRLGELYLNLAEALNEFYGPVAEAYDAVDIIRKRSGMPALERNMNQEQLREKIRNERAIELCMEGHRLYDLRRWEIADKDGIMKGNMYGLKIYPIEGSSECRYEPYVFEIRSFYKRMYRHPFTREEIEKNYLKQNPGY